MRRCPEDVTAVQASSILGDLHHALVRLHVQGHRQLESHVEHSARREVRSEFGVDGLPLAAFVEKLHFYRERWWQERW